MLIAAATACSSGDSTKVFNAAGESTANPSASSPGLAANAAGAGATRTAAPADDDGRAAEKVDDTGTEKISDDLVAPSRRPSPSPASSPSPRATPTAEAEPPMQLARPVRSAPVVVDIIRPNEAPGDGPALADSPAEALPGGGGAVVRKTSPPARAQSRTSQVQPTRPAPDAGWGSPVLVEDFDDWSSDARGYEAAGSGGVLRLGGGEGTDLSGTSAQRYGRWEIRLRAGEGAAPVVLLRSGQSDGPYTEIGVARTGGQLVEFSVRQGQEGARSGLRGDLTGWHTIAVDWLPGRVTFWLDGRQVWNYTGPYVPQSQPMGLALRNDAACGQETTCGDATAMDVDWVRVYQAPVR